MDYKTFKQDITYTCKKIIKDNILLSIDSNNLSIDAEGKLISKESTIGVLDALVLIKGYVPTMEMLQVYYSKWVDPQDVVHENSWIHYEAFGFNTISIISEQASISKEDLYAFLDGLENVAWLGSKNEFYNVGVYIREKFSPLGIRQELLFETKYQSSFIYKGPIMKKFVVHTKPLAGCCAVRNDAPIIVEIEGVPVNVFEDPSLQWSNNGDSKFRILKPESLYELAEVKSPDGSKKKMPVPPVYHSHSVYETLEEAHMKAKKLVKKNLDFEIRKGRLASYTEEELKIKCAEIQEIMLPTA